MSTKNKTKNKKVYVYTKDGKEFGVFNSIAAVARNFNIATSTMSSIIHKSKVYDSKYILSFETLDKEEVINKYYENNVYKSYRKITAKYDSDGKLVEIFDSVLDASKTIKGSHIPLYTTYPLNNKRYKEGKPLRKIGGFYWLTFKTKGEIPESINVVVVSEDKHLTVFDMDKLDVVDFSGSPKHIIDAIPGRRLKTFDLVHRETFYLKRYFVFRTYGDEKETIKRFLKCLDKSGSYLITEITRNDFKLIDRIHSGRDLAKITQTKHSDPKYLIKCYKDIVGLRSINIVREDSLDITIKIDRLVIDKALKKMDLIKNNETILDYINKL